MHRANGQGLNSDKNLLSTFYSYDYLSSRSDDIADLQNILSASTQLTPSSAPILPDSAQALPVADAGSAAALLDNEAEAQTAMEDDHTSDPLTLAVASDLDDISPEADVIGTEDVKPHVLLQTTLVEDDGFIPMSYFMQEKVSSSDNEDVIQLASINHDVDEAVSINTTVYDILPDFVTEAHQLEEHSDHDHDHDHDDVYPEQAGEAAPDALYAEYLANFSENMPENAPTTTGNTILDSMFNLKSINDAIDDFGGILNLSSKPGSKVTMLLDFDGWSGTNIFAGPINASPWNNWNMSALSDAAKADIYSIWLKVSEAFSMFDVNVTTKDPMDDSVLGPDWFVKSGDPHTWASQGGRMVMTQNFTGESKGGYAYINSFASKEPGFVFNKTSYAGTSAVHEFGHMLGLSHDGINADAYYYGHGSGATKWSPLMGAGFTALSQWSKGEYTGANNLQDDLAVMTSGYLTLVADDHSNNLVGATYISTGDDNVFGHGNITTRTDTDVFRFATGDGNVNIDIKVASGGIYNNLSSLDILATLYDSAGNVVTTSNPLDQLNANFNLNLTAGDYYIRVDGTGLAGATGYTDYGSLGNYFISGTTAAIAGGGSNTAPTNLVDANGTANTVAENAAVGSSVGITAQASDADGDTLTYSLTNNAGGKFAINSSTGVVTVASALNYETATSHTITVKAADAGGLFTTQDFTINVTNVNEAPTSLVDANAAANTVAENVSVGATVGMTAQATDPDAGTTLTYSLTSDAGGKFAINSSTGVVTVASALDYETATSHTITVKAADAGGLSTSQNFTINVTNINEAPHSMVDNDASANLIAENAAIGTVVGITARATDPESGALIYSLDDSAGGKFAINSSTGIITLAAAVDYETATSHTITVRATDAGGLSTTKNFTINVTDANDAPMSLVDTNAAANTVAEDAAVGTVVGITARATDPEGGALTYSLTDSAGGKFAINSSTGIVTVAAALDYESASSHTITVRATDAGGLSTTQNFTIAVTNINEAPLNMVDSDATANSIAENATVGMGVGITAQATDPEGNALTYSLLDDAGGKFAINGVTGVVTVASALDYETANSHNITVKAADAGGLFTTNNFTIAVTDVVEGAGGGGGSGGGGSGGGGSGSGGGSGGGGSGGGGSTNNNTNKVVLPSQDLGSAGNDNYTGTAGADNVLGLGGDDIISAGDGSDTVNGNQGNDNILGGNGSDVLLGGKDNDMINGNQDDDLVNGNMGNDFVLGGQGNDNVHGGQDNDDVNGNFGDDIVFGDLGDDIARGGQGNDAIYGNEGNDSLHGDKGNDTLSGGEGTDYFYFNADGGNDVVSDFASGTDMLFISSALFTTAEQAAAAFNNGVLDMGNGNSITLEGVNRLTSADIFIF